jgi:hypothetical protein
MGGLEMVCAAIVALYVVLRSRRAPGVRGLLTRLGWIAAAGWVGEDSVMRAYDFYKYSTSWHFFIDRTPLLIVLIWPVVIHSAWDLAGNLLKENRRWVPLVGAALVLADASLIEPIAVRAGLWSWSEPGLFAVPPIGILGWAFFAWAVMTFFDRVGPAIVVVAPAVAHALLLATWWGGLRWVNRAVPEWPPVALVWGLGLWLAAAAWRTSARARVPFVDMMARAPAAGFFFVLLALHGRGAPALQAWAIAFAPPYLALIGRPRAIRA